jgi:leucyl-tRNA synthetase
MRFANAVWRMVGRVGAGTADEGEPAPFEIDRLVHKTIKKVTEDIDRLRMNTALAALIELNNEPLMISWRSRPKSKR